MSKHPVPLKLDYVIFNTGYTARFTRPRCEQDLMRGLKDRNMNDITPLYIQDNLCGDGKIVRLSTDVNETEATQLEAIGREVGNLCTGTVAFKVTQFSDIFSLMYILKYYMDYCTIHGISDIEYTSATVNDKNVWLAFVSVDATNSEWHL